jgi:hypothetical protein
MYVEKCLVAKRNPLSLSMKTIPTFEGAIGFEKYAVRISEEIGIPIHAKQEHQYSSQPKNLEVRRDAERNHVAAVWNN